MKTYSQRRGSRGFTLVELLVVISIIVVLAAMSFGGIQLVTKRAKTLQTQSDATALYQAIEQYYQEYSKLPGIEASSEEIQTSGEAGVELLRVLLGKEDDTGTMQNPRKLAFLTVKESKNAKKGGLVYSNGGAGGQIEGLYDAWGKPFNVKFDIEYEGEIEDPIVQGNVVRNKVAIVYSFGQDGKLGVDDVKTW
ncbi:MAG: type II secretion system protein [Verrucomicrobia bacterium]|nr:MAG: type II secretion system protein [Verrucomicrobiota bacterium]TAE88057.1 MAG: type II secretion system protein [Verrucomicrobiota bacterium]TAF26269.1 MAG: type II secretion system protein [Verrucomicrobiota bacterium]TAF41836.1 MAG: type II secretion system protein [Verrucomicrobiota bacterium]